MAHIAPEERITIRYTPYNSDTSKELPLKLLIMGDFKGHTHPDVDPLALRKPVAVDHTTFEHVMAASAIQLQTRIEEYTPLLNTISGQHTKRPLDIQLRFSQLKDFHPDSLIRQIPELRSMLRFRQLLSDLKSSLGPQQTYRILCEIAELAGSQYEDAQAGTSHE